MKPILLLVLCMLSPWALAEEGTAWVRQLKDRAERGKLEDRAVSVRGDTGRWRDLAQLQLAPAPPKDAGPLFLDDWADQHRKFGPTSAEETWLIFRTRQFDDYDRIWLERIDRQGTRFIFTAKQAIWQGVYSKSFTYYRVMAINLGKLAPGDYEVSWKLDPLTFTEFEDPKNRQVSASKNEQADKASGEGEKRQFELKFTVK